MKNLICCSSNPSQPTHKFQQQTTSPFPHRQKYAKCRLQFKLDVMSHPEFLETISHRPSLWALMEIQVMFEILCLIMATFTLLMYPSSESSRPGTCYGARIMNLRRFQRGAKMKIPWDWNDVCGNMQAKDPSISLHHFPSNSEKR